MDIESKKADFLALPLPFGFYKAILKGDHLHFGLWPEGQEGIPIEVAQQNMFERLASFLPPSPATLLDVGCGLGYSANILAQKGYKVVAIAPDPELINYATHNYEHADIEFKVLGFLDNDEAVFEPGRYDVILMQESAQYLGPLDNVMKKARLLLKENGVIIIGDEVCYDKSIKNETAVHLATDFTVALAENGFRITENRKLGSAVLPTCDFVIDGFTRNQNILESLSGDTGKKLKHYLEGWKKQKGWYSCKKMGYEIFAAKKDSFFIKPYKANDEHRILPMFNAIFNVNRTIEHWYWKFRDNPYGSYKISEAFSKEGSLVAHYAGYPLPFYSETDTPNTFLSYQIGDTMTSPEVRNIGLGKTGLLARIANHFYAKFCNGEVPFIYGFNTGHIKKLGMRYLGYQYIDPVAFWVKEISNADLQYKDLPKGYTIAENFAVNAEWDDFFNSVRSSYKFLVTRNSEYIKWRYLACPDRVHRIFSVRKNGELAGWGVFTRKDNRLIWGDALFDRRFPEAALTLIQGLLEKQYFPGAVSIEAWFPAHPEWLNNQIKELDFEKVREPNDLTPGFVVFNNHNLFEKLRTSFYYTIGDSDLF